MFGYIQPYIPELKVKEYEQYKGVYCGLCHQLGRSFKKTMRLTLSYDFTFLAMVYYGTKATDMHLTKGRCGVNPLARVKCFKDSAGIEYAADAAMIMIYYKMQDNIDDSSGIKKLFWRLAAKFTNNDKNKAAQRQPQINKMVKKMMQMQRQVEQNNTASIDSASEPTATALAGIMQDIYDGENGQRMGYLLGRFIYICDAMDDIKSDIKNNNYNPFVVKYVKDKSDEKQIAHALEQAKESLFMTIGELAGLSQDMRFNLFEATIHNILEQGLYHSAMGIYKKEGGVTDESV